jgi:hypothetical protein
MHLHGQIGKTFPAGTNQDPASILVNKHPETFKTSELRNGAEQSANVDGARESNVVDSLSKQQMLVVADKPAKLFRDFLESPFDVQHEPVVVLLSRDRFFSGLPVE